MSLVDLAAIEERAAFAADVEPETSVAHRIAREDVPALVAEVRQWRSREAARLRDAATPESIPELVLDAAFASQASWWHPGDDAHSPVVQVSTSALGARQQHVVIIATLVEEVAEATYRAAIAEGMHP